MNVHVLPLFIVGLFSLIYFYPELCEMAENLDTRDDRATFKGDITRIFRWLCHPLLKRRRPSTPPILPPDFDWQGDPPQDVFEQGMRDYKSFRIPALIRHNDKFFAFCEARMTAFGDAGARMDIVLRIGKTTRQGLEWGDIQTVASVTGYRAMNPVPIVDRRTGHIILVFTVFPETPTEAELVSGTTYHQKVLLMRSKDDGISWSEKPVDITDQTIGKMPHPPHLFSSGPGHGIQLTSGRLIVPGNVHWKDEHTDCWTEFIRKFFDGFFRSKNSSIVFYSDNGGETWEVGGEIEAKEDEDGNNVRSNECQAAEIEDDHVYVNSRTQRPSAHRQESHSTNKGEKFDRRALSEYLEEPGYFLSKYIPALVKRGGCHGSIISFEPLPEDKVETDKKRWVVFSNPANGYVRSKMSLRLSRDGCETWSRPFLLNPNPSAYSDLTFYKTTKNTDGESGDRTDHHDTDGSNTVSSEESEHHPFIPTPTKRRKTDQCASDVGTKNTAHNSEQASVKIEQNFRQESDASKQVDLECGNKEAPEETESASLKTTTPQEKGNDQCTTWVETESTAHGSEHKSDRILNDHHESDSSRQVDDSDGGNKDPPCKVSVEDEVASPEANTAQSAKTCQSAPDVETDNNALDSKQESDVSRYQDPDAIRDPESCQGRENVHRTKETIKIACLYECGDLHPYERIAFQTIDLDVIIKHDKSNPNTNRSKKVTTA